MKKRQKLRRKLAKVELLRIAAYRLSMGETLPADLLAYVKRGAAGDLPLYTHTALEKPKAKTDFYQSSEWLRLRYRALELHGGLCQCCGRGRADGIKLHVDHIKPRSKFPKLALVLENLQVLCGDCNMGKSNISARDWRSP